MAWRTGYKRIGLAVSGRCTARSNHATAAPDVGLARLWLTAKTYTEKIAKIAEFEYELV